MVTSLFSILSQILNSLFNIVPNIELKFNMYKVSKIDIFFFMSIFSNAILVMEIK